MIIIALVLCVPPGSQAQALNSAPESQKPGLSSTRGAESLTTEAGARKRVIVKLRIAFKPEGLLDGVSAVQSQRAAIDQAQNALMSRLSNQNITHIYTYEYIPYIALEVDAAGLQALTAAPEVASVAEDIPEPPLLDISNPLIGAPTAWAAGATGAGQTVAILDTGVDKTHPFLSGKVVSEACYSTTDGLYSSTSVCPGSASESTASGSGLNCSTSISGCDHGTHVAGIVAGNQVTAYNSYQGSNKTFSGVAPGASLIAIQVFSRFDSSTYCGGTTPCALTFTSDQIKALERVYALRTTYSIASINMSLGGGQYTAACDADARKAAIDNLRSAGIATVIASGNNGYSDSVSAPACISSAIAVGSTTSYSAGVPQDQVSSFSNSASMVGLLAPGHFIFSSIPGSSYDYKAGTSMATPHVAGAWAVLKSAASNASVTDVLNALTTTGVPITAVRSGYPNITKPRIQVDTALNTLFPAPTSLTASGVSQTQITLSWSQTNAYETSFKVERSPNGTSGWTQIGTAATNATSYPDTTAVCNTTYYYRVRAATISFNSAYSNTASGTSSACGAAVTLSASSLSFGSQRVGTTSTPQSVTLTNSGSVTLNLSNITVSGDFARSGGSCPTSFPATLTAGASCTISLIFTPSVTGTLTGTLNISSDASGSPHAVSLSGTGTATPPPAAVTPSVSSLDFGNQPVGTTSMSQSITLTNTGGTVLTIDDIVASGDFAVETTCGATLDAGASCTITVAFTPTATGAQTGALTISSDAGDGPHTVTLSGTGTEFFRVLLPLITRT
jgi:subtilisin family serine protease